ncbi:MAG: carbamoyltransferase N-terminal domain-containing protein, partial [Vicinamibacterales bacterium]
MIIVGLNAYHGDASAVLVRDGTLVAAVEEERFRRIKHYAGFPTASLRQCLDIAGLRGTDVDHFAVSRDPRANRVRKALFAISHRPRPRRLWDRIRNARRVQDVALRLADDLDLDTGDVRRRMHWVEHHPAHLASAFFVSGFDEAAMVAIDGFGDFVGTSWAVGRGSHLTMLDRVYFPHSLGLLYLALTQYLGFPRYGDEYKVMGLAPYGEPAYVPEIQRLIRLKPRGHFELDLSYFSHWSDGVSMTWDDGEPTIGPVYTRKLEALLGPARGPTQPLDRRHEAIAASLQTVFEEAIFHVLNALYERTRLFRVCLAGGCALNSVANGKIRANTPFRDVYIQPASGDNGTALGAALAAWHRVG